MRYTEIDKSMIITIEQAFRLAKDADSLIIDNNQVFINNVYQGVLSC